MYTNHSIFYLILSFCVINKIFTQNNPNDIGKCNCDLSIGHCDLNCCCDNDCSQLDLDIFKCSEKANSTTRQWCIPNSALFLSNTPYIISTLGDLVCVDVNNTLSLNYYLAPLTDSIEIKDSFISLISNAIAPQNVKNAFEIPSSDYPFNKTNYVYALLRTNDISFLSLPTQVGSTCRPGPPAYHYQDKASNCIISPQNLKDECSATTSSTLSLKYFFNQLKFIKKPNSLQKCFENIESATNPLDYYSRCNENYLVQLSIRSCMDEDGLTIDPNECANKLEPSLNVDTCTNLVKSVSYILRFNSANGIIQAGLDVVLFNQININTNTRFIEQTFKIFFIPESIDFNNFNLVTNRKLSGNPGYLRGKPIVVGSSSLPADRTNRLTYFIPNSQGMCQNDDNSRASINFRENVVSECLFKPTFDPTSNDYCKLVQNSIDEIILGFARDKRATRFAPFATSDPDTWISIVNSDSSVLPDVTNLNGVCKSVRVGATIQIAFALVGNVAKPQAKIQFISYNWNEKTDIKITCSGQICIGLTNLMIKVSTRVVFVDVSQPPLYTESMMARPQTTLPGDFFYPIINSSKKVEVSKYLLFFLFYYSFYNLI